jgi:hypothetical protein
MISFFTGFFVTGQADRPMDRKQGKQFFFEKKNQKTFICYVRLQNLPFGLAAETN